MNPHEFSDRVSTAMDAMPEPGKDTVVAALDLIIKALEDGQVALEGAKGEMEQAVATERERCAKIAESHDRLYADRPDSVRVACDEIALEIREPSDAQDAACEEVAEHPNMLEIRLGGKTTIHILNPAAMGLTVEDFCAQWVYPALEMLGMKHAEVSSR